MFLASSMLAVAVLGSAAPAITTTIFDAYKQMPQLDFFQPAFPRSLTWLPRTGEGGFILLPGAYSWTVQAYCMNATKHAPRGDAAYLAAPLRGPSAANLRALLRREEQSNMSQGDVQALVWTLTSRQDMLNVLSNAQQMMTAMRQPQLQAGSIMSSLVAESAAADNHGVPRSRWTYIKPGYFVRLANSGYTRLRIEVYVPERWRMTRDSAHRVSSLSNAAGSRIDLMYQAQAASVRVMQQGTVNPGLTNTASATVRYAGGANESNTVALRQLEAAIRAAIILSPTWGAERDHAADDVARTRAELVCSQVPCSVTPEDFPHVPVVKTTKDKEGRTTLTLAAGPAFNLTTIAAVPSDTKLQSLTMAARNEDGVPPPTGAAKTADKNADCPEVADFIIQHKIARAVYSVHGYIEMAMAKRKSGEAYNDAMISVIEKLINGGKTAADVPSPAVDAMVQSALSTPATAHSSSNPQPLSDGGKIEKLAYTNVQDCNTTYTPAVFQLPAILGDAIREHEYVHQTTCKAIRLPVGKKPDTPKTRGEDEVRAYDVSIKVLQDWYASNCS